MAPGNVIADRLTPIRELWDNPGLRRAQLAWGGFHVAEWASLVALSVVAYEADGTAAVGLVLFARMVPSAFVAPLVAAVGDRYRRERILLVVHAVRALACAGAAAALAADSDPVVVYVLAVLAAVPLAAHRPSHLALAPLLARTPRELAASNVAALTFESAAVLLGPALAALLLAALGERDSMYVTFERAIDVKDPDTIWFLNAIPSLRPMRQEPRYQRLLERMGLPKEWRN